VLSLAALLTGCGYSLALKNGLLDGHNVQIGMFANRSYQPDVEAKLRLAMVNELLARGEHPVTAEANLMISGEVEKLVVQTVAYTAADKAGLYRVSMTVAAELFDKKSGKVLWKGGESLSQDFPATLDLALQKNARDAAVAEVCRSISKVLLARMTQSF
jgi:hypothetical protein